MKYLKFTYLPGNIFPDVAGLQFVWARESAYPTDSPEFFGACPDDSDTDLPGVLGVFVQSDWDQMRLDEMNACVPREVTMRQARLALLAVGKLADVSAAIASLPSPQKEAVQIEWEYSQTVERGRELTGLMAAALGLTSEQTDALFVSASKL